MIKNSYKLRQKLSIHGETEDGKAVLGNSFIFMSTLGLPFDVLIQELNKNNFTIDIEDFCKSALKEGWSKNTIFKKLTENIGDVIDNGVEFKNKLIYVLEKL